MCIRDRLGVFLLAAQLAPLAHLATHRNDHTHGPEAGEHTTCLLYTSDAAGERSSVDLGGRRILIKKKQERKHTLTETHMT